MENFIPWIAPIICSLLWFPIIYLQYDQIKDNLKLKEINIISYAMIFVWIASVATQQQLHISSLIFVFLIIGHVVLLFKVKKKRYQNLRKKIFFDKNGNYLLKGKETRMPM